MEDCPHQLVRTKSQAKRQQLSLLITGKPVIVLLVSQTADGAVVIRLGTTTDAINIIHQSGDVIVWDSYLVACLPHFNFCTSHESSHTRSERES